MIVFIGKDKPESEKIRAANREKHVAMMKELQKKGLIYFAGPFVDDLGKMSGSLIIFNTEDKKMIQDIMGNDPYVKAGLFAARDISRVKKVL
ncbi:MAG: YciI family protein [Desulfonatronovibrio sp. MSAO_Bac4]|nr:MAG: YciI family protein [Desulfonatronovibrio sp. MSAO_Bac4]